MKIAIALSLSVALLASPGSAPAQVYRWTDAEGTIHFSQGLESIPPRFRGDAQRGSMKGVVGEADVVAMRVERIDVGGAAYGPLFVVSHDTGLGRGDGLLGREFLDHFTVTMTALRQLRERSGMSQAELAKKAEVAQGYISALEAGEKKNPGMAVLRRLAKALGVNVAELME